VLGAYLDGKVLTRNGIPSGTLSHEIGHGIDDAFEISKRLADDERYNRETSHLAFYRVDPERTPTAKWLNYIDRPDERFANLVDMMIHSPDVVRQVAPNARDAVRSLLNGTSVGEKLFDLKPSSAINEGFYRLPVENQIAGYHVAAPDVARVLNEYFKPGLLEDSDPRKANAFHAALTTSNLINRTLLALSGHQAISASLAASGSDIGLGLRKISGIRSLEGAAGRIASGVADIGKGSIPLASLLSDWTRGTKIRAEYLGEASGGKFDRTLDALASGGGRVETGRFWKTGEPAKFMNALRNAKYGTGVAHAVPAAIDLLSRPVVEKMIPSLKLGAFSRIMEHELSLVGPDITHEQLRQIATRAWDTVDNRFGQATRDNLLWNNALRDVQLASVGSLGWAKELGGGVTDLGTREFLKTGLSNRSAYVAGLTASTAIAGGLMQYLMTGQRPNQLVDYFRPKTGRKNADGTDERVSLPSQITDGLSAAQGHWENGLREWAPTIYALSRFWKDPQFLKRGLLPYNVQDELRHLEQTGKLDLAPALGANVAPDWATHSPAMLFALGQLGATDSGSSDATKTHILDMYQRGLVKEALEARSKLSGRRREELDQKFQQLDQQSPPLLRVLPRLGMGDVMKAYDLGAPDERQSVARYVQGLTEIPNGLSTNDRAIVQSSHPDLLR
jgi:hypothetical protein